MITLSGAAAISKAKIETLRPEFATRVKDWFNECCQTGFTPYIYEGFRTNVRQAELYAQGRTKPGNIVTNAQAGQSFHNYGLAIDWVPLRRVEKANDMYEADWDNNPIYAVGADLARKFKLRALSWETPHLEDANYQHWKDLISLPPMASP